MSGWAHRHAGLILAISFGLLLGFGLFGSIVNGAGQ